MSAPDLQPPVDPTGGRCDPRANIRFVMELGRALLRFGTPAHRLEESLLVVARRLGLEGEFNSTPTSLVAAFSTVDGQELRLARGEPGSVHLEKLVLLDEVADEVVLGKLDAAGGSARIRAILAAPDRHGPVVKIICFALASVALAIVFGGGAPQAAAAGAVGAIVGALDRISAAWQGFGRVTEIAAAFLTAFLAHAALRLLGAQPVHLTTVTGLIVLVPGFTLTVALIELSTANLVSGTARLMGAAVTFLKLALGVALGGRLGAWFFGADLGVELPAPAPHVWAAALLLASLAISLLLEASPRDIGWILAASVCALAGSVAGGKVAGGGLAPALGAFVATVASNLYARLLHRPARVPLIPSLILLVPGSVGFRSVAFLLEADVVSGVETAFSMSLSAIALAAGVLLANLLVATRSIL